ncbi:hypothetical protein B0T19DRAFT_440153 [Cercophora scortea]|uniref:Uncharacterized protein n=1 Tax=Cercophora scortea TaxID=314031 RepID=A0AAE0MIF3_9PEZI|nr:hypothetical protein B0T19DRAFT_440153 [Cercophora scortea]
MPSHVTSFRSADTVDPDEVVSEDATPMPRAGPGRGGFRGRGRGGSRALKARAAKIAKPSAPTKTAGRGRQKKMFDSLKAQAAYERAQEIKMAYSAAAKALKPALQEVADRSVNEIMENPTIITQVPQFHEIQGFLRKRLDDTLQQNDNQLAIELNMAKHVWEGQQKVVRDSYITQLEELTDEQIDELLLRVERLEYLYDNKLPLDLQEVPDETRYILKDITQEEADMQSAYVDIRDGIEVPFPGNWVSELLTKQHDMPSPATPKRKADGASEERSMSKFGEAGTDLPRHHGGLLAAQEALEDRESTPPESASAAPSPPAEPADAPSPENADQAQTSGASTPQIPQDQPALPRGVSKPDEYGVRIVCRRPAKMDAHNNRIMVPIVHDWDDEEIGFRDSTNSIQKGATKAKRGRYLGKPGSNFLFLDRRVGTWDATSPDNDLDEDLVTKHKLHPSLGVFLPTSVNEDEKPPPPVSGWKPVAFVTPKGEFIHASRTIPGARLEKEAADLERKTELQQQLQLYCQQEGIAIDEISPDQQTREDCRRRTLIARGIDPDEVPPIETPRARTPSDIYEATPPPSTSVFDDFVAEALQADAVIAEAEKEMPQAAGPAQLSRPYDAIRDVFTDNTPSAMAQETAVVPETFNLSCLADAAERQLQSMQYPPHLGTQPAQGFPGSLQGMIDPNLFNHPPVNGNVMRPGEYEQVEFYPPAEYSQVDPSVFNQQNSPNAFLSTALNSPPASYPPPTAADLHEYRDGPMGQDPTQGSAETGRTPFFNPAAAKALPALRPVRSLLNDTPPPPPEPQGSPGPQQHPNMIVSNSGAFFPPAPNRPFHNGFSVPEPAPGQHTIPTQQPMQHQLLANPIQGTVAPGPHGPHHHPPPAPVTSPVPIGPASMMQQGPPPLVNPPIQPLPASPSPRSRPGSSSASSALKYRTLQPAPTPPHRQGYSGNGTELRTVQFDYRESIKDYAAVEPPPRHGPTNIRGWSHNNNSNIKKSRPSAKGDGTSDEPS